MRTLPDFGGRLSAHNCELLLSYLTAPYVRIPLVLRLLAQPNTLPALSSPQLQAVVDAALFEPAAWQPPGEAPQITHVPVPNRAALATPCGLLLNELQHSPFAALGAVETMLELAQEHDSLSQQLLELRAEESTGAPPPPLSPSGC